MRRGWYLGEERFGDKLRRLLKPEVAEKLVGRGKGLEEKSLLASLIRKRTGVRNAWIAERLALGGESNVTVALRRVRESKGLMGEEI